MVQHREKDEGDTIRRLLSAWLKCCHERKLYALIRIYHLDSVHSTEEDMAAVLLRVDCASK